MESLTVFQTIWLGTLRNFYHYQYQYHLHLRTSPPTALTLACLCVNDAVSGMPHRLFIVCDQAQELEIDHG